MPEKQTTIEKINELMNKRYCGFLLIVTTTSLVLIRLIEFCVSLFRNPQTIMFLNTNLEEFLNDAKFLFIYISTSLLIGFVIEMRSSLVKFITEIRSSLKYISKRIKRWSNVIAADGSIKESIEKAIYKNEIKQNLPIRIYGIRLRQNARLITTILNSITFDRKNHREVDLYLYYSDIDYLNNVKQFRQNDSKLVAMIDSDINDIRKNIQNINNTIDLSKEKLDFLKVHHRKHSDLPQFWAIQIDDKEIFWGYFTWEENENSDIFKGSVNDCFHFNSEDMELQGFNNFYEWVDNNFKRLEEWHKRTEKSKETDTKS